MGVEQRCLSRLYSLCGAPDIDLFASRLNHKVPKYTSWKPDPLASFVHAFTLNWREFSNAYAFSPFCHVGRCLQKVMLPQATLAVVVLLWCTQAWFTRLLIRLIDHPRLRINMPTLQFPPPPPHHIVFSRWLCLSCPQPWF